VLVLPFVGAWLGLSLALGREQARRAAEENRAQ
jgi:hypothetical protein